MLAASSENVQIVMNCTYNASFFVQIKINILYLISDDNCHSNQYSYLNFALLSQFPTLHYSHFPFWCMVLINEVIEVIGLRRKQHIEQYNSTEYLKFVE